MSREEALLLCHWRLTISFMGKGTALSWITAPSDLLGGTVISNLPNLYVNFLKRTD